MKEAEDTGLYYEQASDINLPLEQDTYAFPLSFAQHRLWFLDQMENVGSTFNIYSAFIVDGAFQVPVLKKAIQFLIDRHESFRTRFDLIDGKAVQIIQPSLTAGVEVEEAGGSFELSQADEMCRKEAGYKFDLKTGPLFRIKVMKYAADKHLLSFCFHHIISDGWSVGVFAREFQLAYMAFLNDEPVPLNELTLQYADYAVWQREWFENGQMQKQIDFWKEKLLHAPGGINLLYDKPRKPVQTFAGDNFSFVIREEQVQKLKELSAKAGTTMFMTLLSAFSVLLAKCSLQKDLVIGSVIANRNRKELESLIGFLVNVVVFRIGMENDPVFMDLLKKVRSEVLDVYDNQDVPFDKLLDELKVERDISSNPLFQVMFVMQNESPTGTASHLPGLTITPLETDNKTTKYDLTLGISPQGNNLHAVFQYNIDLFERQSIEKMAGHFCNLLDHILADPGEKISAYSLVSSSEQAEVFRCSYPLAVAYPEDSVVAMVEKQAMLQPSAIALADSGKQLTYQQLNETSDKLAAHLSGKLQPGCIAAVCLERSADLIVYLLAILKTGAAYLAIDTAYPDERKIYMLKDSSANLIITDKAHAHIFSQQNIVVELHEQLQQLDDIDVAPPAITHDPLAPAYIIYTSGSTGQPKGIAIHHKALQNLVHWHNNAFALTNEDVTTQVAGISFDACVWEIWPALCAGAALHIIDKEQLLDPPTLQATVMAKGITTCFWPTPLAEYMFVLEWPKNVSLRQVLIGGDTFRRRLNKPLPFDVIENYGLSEACVVNTSGKVDVNPLAVATIGKPIANTCVLILDEHMRPVPAGVYGELYIAGEGLALKGYINNQQQTAERFIPNPFKEIPYSTLYKTGDTGSYTHNGEIRYMGRADRQVKIRGHRIEIPEIEAGILSVDTISTCAVLVKQRADNSNFLVAFVVADMDVKEIRSRLYEKLPVNMIPSMIVRLTEMPLTPNGKIDHKSLEVIEVDQPSDSAKREQVSESESVLIQIWEEVLNIADIHPDDNFFELGGDSINTIQVASKARELNLELTSKHIFLYQTVRELAREIKRKEVVVHKYEDTEEPFSLHPIQSWFFSQLATHYNQFNHSLAIYTPIGCNAGLLENAFHILGEHHAALRLRFYHKDGAVVQAYDSNNWKEQFSVYEVHEADATDAQHIIEKEAAALQASLDVYNGSLYRIVYFDRGADMPGTLLFVFHHLIVDSFSWRVLLKDFISVYKQLEAGQEAILPTKTISYQGYIQYLQSYMQSDAYSNSIAYWLENRAPALLPVDALHTSNTFGDAEIVEVTLDAIHSDKLLKELSKAYRTGVQTILVAVLAKTLSDWAGQPQVSISLESLGRHENDTAIDLSQTIGWFTSLYPVHLNATGNQWPDIVRSIKEDLNKVPGNGLAYGVGKYLAKDERLTAQPYPRLCFNYHGQVDDSNETGSWSMAEGNYGKQIAASFPRVHLIDINCAIERGGLKMRWIHNPAIHATNTIEQLAGTFLNNLRNLLDQHASDAVYYTPSDFPHARLSMEQLNKIVGESKNVTDIYRLTPMQQGMVFQSLYSGNGSNAYFVQVALSLDGALDVAALRQAWQDTVNNHTILRTAFVWEGVEEMVQVVHDTVNVPWEYTDITYLHANEITEKILEWQQQGKEGFDLNKSPLLRIHLVKITEQQYRMIWSYHHAIVDGWSMPLILKEVFARYTLKGDVAKLKIHSANFRDYVAWIDKQNRNAAGDFWETELSMIDEPVHFQPDLKKTGNDNFQYAEERSTIEDGEYRQLELLLRKNKITANTLFQSLWSLIAGKYSGKSEVVFGTTVSGRPPEIDGVEKMIGLFINTIPVNINIAYDLSLVDWLQQIQAKQVEREQYAYLSLVDIQQLTQQKTALFDSILIVENYPTVNDENAESKTGLKIGFANAYERIEFPICVTVGANDSLNIKISYNAALFSAALINGLLSHFRNAIQYIIGHADAIVLDIPLLSAEEINCQVGGLNPAPVPVADKTVIGLFEEQVQNRGDAVAVSDGHETLSYSELNKRSTHLARHITGLAIGDKPVAVLMDRSVDMLVALMAVMKAGKAYIPLDPSFPAERLTIMLDDAEPGLIVKDIYSEADNVHTPIPIVYYKDAMSDDEQGIEMTLPVPTSSAYIIYTSGSTGKPKGVEIGQGALTNLLLSFKKILAYKPGDKFLALTTISFDIAALELYLPLISGGEVYIGSGKDAFHTIQTINTYQPAFIQATPSAWNMLTEAGWQGDVSVTILAGGEALLSATAKQLAANCREVINVYGPTETTIWSSYYKLDEATDYTGRYITIGKPIDNTSFYVLDNNRRIVPLGQPGQLYIGGRGLAKGYYRNPAETQSRFTDHVFENGHTERLYCTGDVVRYMLGGNLEYIERADTQVKVRGFRIETGDIEAAMLQYPGIVQAVVVARKDEARNDTVLIGCFIAKEGTDPSVNEIKKYLQQLLPAYMIPAWLQEVKQFPLTLNNKIDRKKLAAQQVDSMTEDKRIIQSRSLVEMELLEIWERVFDRDRLSIRDNFFELGGHSILAVKLMSRVQQHFGESMPVSLLFQHPTVEQLAAVIGKESKEAGRLLVRMKEEAGKTPILLFPGEGGNVVYLNRLVKHLPDGHAVYGLQLPGLDGLSEPAGSVEELATLYIDIIENELPGTPLILAGHSFGGQVAFEIACRLQHRVEKLLMLDTPAPVSVKRAEIPDDAVWLGYIVNRIGAMNGADLAFDATGLDDLPIMEQFEEVKKVLVAADIIPEYFKTEQLRDFFCTLRVTQGISYIPSMVPAVDIAVLKANNSHYINGSALEGIANVLQVEDYGWGRFISGEVTVKHISGDHDSMLSEPYVKQLAEVFSEIINSRTFNYINEVL